MAGTVCANNSKAFKLNCKLHAVLEEKVPASTLSIIAGAGVNSKAHLRIPTYIPSVTVENERATFIAFE